MVGAVLILVGLAVLGLPSMIVPPLAAVALAVLAGSLGSLGGPARDKLVDALSSPADIGRNFAVSTIGIMVGNAVVPSAFGALIERTGYGRTFAVIGGVALLAAVATVAIVARYREDLSLAGAASPGD